MLECQRKNSFGAAGAFIEGREGVQYLEPWASPGPERRDETHEHDAPGKFTNPEGVEYR